MSRATRIVFAGAAGVIVGVLVLMLGSVLIILNDPWLLKAVAPAETRWPTSIPDMGVLAEAPRDETVDGSLLRRTLELALEAPP